ncbi:hypothetical protein M9458_001653, partial [Cirrhinus mrigala]
VALLCATCVKPGLRRRPRPLGKSLNLPKRPRRTNECCAGLRTLGSATPSLLFSTP